MKRFFEILRRHAEYADAVDFDLLVRLRDSRDDGACAELLRRHGPMVWAVCCRGLANVADAEDAFQVVFLVLFRKAARLGPGVPLAPWLYRTAVWTVNNARRRQRIRRVAPLDAELAAKPNDTFELDDLLSSLPEKYRSPIVLCHLQGLSRTEAATALGIAEGTLSARLHRGLQRLKAQHVAGLLALAPMVLLPTHLTAVTTQTLLGVGTCAVAVSPAVLHLTTGVLRMFWIKKVSATVLLSTGISVGVVGYTLSPGTGNQAVGQAPLPLSPTPPAPVPLPPPSQMPVIPTLPAPVPKAQTPEEKVKQAEAELEAAKRELARANLMTEVELLQYETLLMSAITDGTQIEISPSIPGYRYTEVKGSQNTIVADFTNVGYVIKLLKRAELDPDAPKKLSVVINTRAAQQPNAEERQKVRDLVQALIAAKFTKVKFTGPVPDEVEYQITGKMSTRADTEKGDVTFAMSTQVKSITKETSKWLKGIDIDLTKAFPADYLAMPHAADMPEAKAPNVNFPGSMKLTTPLLPTPFGVIDAHGQAVAQNKKPDRVGRIIVEGNTVTDQRVILNQLGLYPGQILQRPQLERAKFNLLLLGLFDKEDPPTVEEIPNEFDGQYKDIRVRVKETRTGIVGILVNMNSDTSVNGNLATPHAPEPVLPLPTLEIRPQFPTVLAPPVPAFPVPVK